MFSGEPKPVALLARRPPLSISQASLTFNMVLRRPDWPPAHNTVRNNTVRNDLEFWIFLPLPVQGLETCCTTPGLRALCMLGDFMYDMLSELVMELKTSKSNREKRV